jgi:hypothetical protein
VVPQHDQDLGTWWTHQRKSIDKASRPLFDSLLLLTVWCLWKERNVRVFHNTLSSAHDVASAVTREAEDWATAGFTPVAVLQALWS